MIGAGGVGGYFGARLAASTDTDTTFIARGAHLAALREVGLKLKSTFGDLDQPVKASDSPEDVGPCDYVLFCVKSFDTEQAAQTARPLLQQDTAIVSFQNGVDNEERIAAILGREHVMGGVAFIFSSITEPGVITHTGGPSRIVFGELDGRKSDRAERLLMLAKDAGIDAKSSDNIQALLWDKFTFICAQAGLTAATRLPIGEVRSVPESWNAFHRILEEVVAVAQAEGVALTGDVVDRHVSFAQKLEPGSYSSLYNDMISGHRMELDALHGALVKRAAGHGIPVPISEAIYAVLKPWALRNELLAKGQG